MEVTGYEIAAAGDTLLDTVLRKIWQDPVWSKIIATAILGGAGWFAYHWWPGLRSAIAAFWMFLLATSPVPHWLLGSLILIALIAVLMFISNISKVVLPDENPYGNVVPVVPDWHSYRDDDFFGLRWRWGYDNNMIQRPMPFCPICDYQLLPDNTMMFAGSVCFHCDSCRKNVATLPESWDSLQSKVGRFIEQKIRTGKWPDKSTEQR